MSPEAKVRLEAVVQAMWPHGFACEKCGGRQPPLLRGWVLQCQECGEKYNFGADERIRIIVRSQQVTEIIVEVCLVFGVPIETVLGRGRRADATRARHSAVRQSYRYLIDSEMCELFRFSSHRDLKVATERPTWSCDLWKEALEERKRKAERYERRVEQNRTCRERTRAKRDRADAERDSE